MQAVRNFTALLDPIFSAPPNQIRLRVGLPLTLKDLRDFYLHNVSAFVRYLAFFLRGSGNAILNVTMSFGFSVSDFITILQLANNIRERFVDAPEQFKAISDE